METNNVIVFHLLRNRELGFRNALIGNMT